MLFLLLIPLFGQLNSRPGRPTLAYFANKCQSVPSSLDSCTENLQFQHNLEPLLSKSQPGPASFAACSAATAATKASFNFHRRSEQTEEEEVKEDSQAEEGSLQPASQPASQGQGGSA